MKQPVLTDQLLEVLILKEPLFPNEERKIPLKGSNILKSIIQKDWLRYNGMLAAVFAKEDPKDLLQGKDVVYEIGTLAEIKYFVNTPSHNIDVIEVPNVLISDLNSVEYVVIKGICRIRIKENGTNVAGNTVLRVDTLSFDEPFFNKEIIADIKQKFASYIQMSYEDVYFSNFIKQFSENEAGYMCDAIAMYMLNKKLNPHEAQKVLSSTEVISRVKLVQSILDNELRRLSPYSVTPTVDQSVTTNSEATKNIGIPDEVVKRITEAEMRMNSSELPTSEKETLRAWLNWVKKLPWQTRTEEALDLNNVREILNRNHYDQEKVKERIIEYLAVRKLAKEKAKPSILCFVGPPGTGKTSLARSISEALGRKFFVIPLGARTDTTELSGNLRVWVGAEPGEIIKGFVRLNSKNPVILLDEIDKVQSIPSNHGAVSSFLLSLLDPEQNKAFVDNYLGLPFDVSEALFITTANTLANLPEVLLDRMEIIEVPSYSLEDKFHILKEYLYPKQIVSNGLDNIKVTLSDEVFQKIVRSQKYRLGIRSIERALEEILRKVAREVVQEQKQEFNIGVDNLTNYIDSSLAEVRLDTTAEVVGSALALAVTTYGGDVISIESITIPGSKGIKVTGLAGQTLEESAKVAYTYLTKNDLVISETGKRESTNYTLHIHLNEAATPKDGPSAGLAIYLAMFSAVTNTPVRQDIAVTGEINLNGKVMPVGGINDKLQAANNAGLTRVVIPKQNMEEANTFLRNNSGKLQVYPVETITEAVRIVFGK